MKFRTEITEIDASFMLWPDRPVIGAGSCFASNITDRMRDCLWDASTPLGVLFNPLSIAEAIKLCISSNPYPEFENSLFQHNDIISSWLFDSSVSSQTKSGSREKFKIKRDEFINKLIRGKRLIITFGTAYCYFLADKKDYVVANCHKVPAQCFKRRRVSAEEIAKNWTSLIDNLLRIEPELKIIFTVSPVRHVKDGLHENNLSKAVLHLAVEKICQSHECSLYFPAFELLNDDLRDYRFYADDLVHPSSQAIEYIWEKFKEAFLDEEGLKFLREGKSLNRRLNHRTIISDTKESEEFKRMTDALFEKFIKEHPESLAPVYLTNLS